MKTVKRIPCKISNLKRGDIVIHRRSENNYVVTANYGSYAIAIDSIHISNEDEWVVLVISDNDE